MNHEQTRTDTNGNSAAMREALITCRNIAAWIRSGNASVEAGVERIQTEIDKALSAPARNCDVGTAEEQLDRYGVYCQNRCTSCDNRHYCHICGERYRMKCMMEWAQMPYEAEEGGAK